MRVWSGVDDLVTDTCHGAPVRRYRSTAPTLVECLDRGRRRWPDRPLVVSDVATTTYADFAELVEGAARHLVDDLGMRPGDRLAVCLPNGLDIAVAIWACARADLVFVGLSTRLAPDAWAYLLEHSRSGLVLADPEHLPGLHRAAQVAGLPAERVVEVGTHLIGRREPWREDVPPPPADATYAVIYTSGTTGRPKAIRMTHRGTMQAAEHYVRAFGLAPADRTAVTFPFYYLSGHVTQLNPAMLSGGSVVPVTDLRPSAIVDLCARHQVTWLDIVPSLLAQLPRVEAFAWPALPALRLAVYGGSPMLPGVVERLRAVAPQLRLCDAYGLTETAVAFCCLYDHEMERKPGSVGRPIPTADLRLVNDDGHDVPAGAAGELWVRGPFLTPGYDRDPQASAAAFTDGWFHTGDIARIDEEGYVFVLDRKKDMIIRGGMKVFSAEVEACLATHADVAEVAVLGVPDRTAYEAVAAYVVAAPGATVDPLALRQHVRERIADYAAPRFVRAIDALPRNRTGKVDKVALRERLVAEQRPPPERDDVSRGLRSPSNQRSAS